MALGLWALVIMLINLSAPSKQTSGAMRISDHAKPVLLPIDGDRSARQGDPHLRNIQTVFGSDRGLQSKAPEWETHYTSLERCEPSSLATRRSRLMAHRSLVLTIVHNVSVSRFGSGSLTAILDRVPRGRLRRLLEKMTDRVYG